MWRPSVLCLRWYYDNPWPSIPSLLVEPSCNNRFIPFAFECHQVSHLCCLQDHLKDYGPPLLDSYQLNIQFLFFKLTMSPNGEGIMARHFGLNSIFKLCKKIYSFAILTKKINEHMKLVEIAMAQMKKHSTIFHSCKINCVINLLLVLTCVLRCFMQKK
jgi:hypothetical protein